MRRFTARMLRLSDAGGDRAAKPKGRRSRRQRTRNSRRSRCGSAGRRLARRHARTLALRLSARRPAAAAGVCRRLRVGTRGTCGAGDAGHGAGRLPGAGTGALLQRDGRRARRARCAGLPQAEPAELHGVRRRTLLRDRHRPLRIRGRRCTFRPHHLRGRVVRGARGASQGRRRAGARRAQRLAVPHAGARTAARAGRRAHPRMPPSGHLREPRRRPGRARLRWSIVRGRCDRRAGAAGAGMARDPRPRALRRRGAEACARKSRTGAGTACLRRAGDGRARLCRQEPLSRRTARPLGRRRLRADAGGGGRRARRPRACAR